MATTNRTFDDLGHYGGFSHRGVDLAHEKDFRLGATLIEPSRLRISRPGYPDQTIEPRAMQVLSALHRAKGAVVGRDDLIEGCWDGRIVGENSITRVISLLRRAAESFGKKSFEIETIPKVGYCLTSPSVAAEDEAETALPAPSVVTGGATGMNRRRVLAGLAAAGVGGLAAAGATTSIPYALTNFRVFGGHVPTPEARELYDAGMRAQYFGLNATSEQAELYFRRAAQADPEWADAWASLAMSHRHMMDGATPTNQWRLVEETRAASNRALELEPGNAEAIVALALLRSPLDRWLDSEREYSELLERFPQSFVLRSHYARVLADLGRFGEAVKHTATNVADHPLMPLMSIYHQASLWGARRLQEAEAEIERAYRLFAKCHLVWFMRSGFLTYNGRAWEALSFTSNRDGWPAEMPGFLFERRHLTAQAILTRSPADIDAVMRAIDTYIERCLSVHPFAIDPWWPVPFLSAIGDLDTAFDILDSFYLWRGPLAPPPHAAKGPLTRRDTSLLFMPTLANVRQDKRFAELVEAIGLTAQFRASGSWPDYWRPAS